eukprot:352209-Hanusia_phi.AAC.2
MARCAPAVTHRYTSLSPSFCSSVVAAACHTVPVRPAGPVQFHRVTPGGLESRRRRFPGLPPPGQPPGPVSVLLLRPRRARRRYHM